MLFKRHYGNGQTIKKKSTKISPEDNRYDQKRFRAKHMNTSLSNWV